ncbi:MAG: chorismate mutase [Frankiaceae bacterium]|nr:chorismate mutase [Frankiaceae bacterium]
MTACRLPDTAIQQYDDTTIRRHCIAEIPKRPVRLTQQSTRGAKVTVRAVRGAVQLAADDSDEMSGAVSELVSAVLDRNGLTADDVISILFTATPDLVCDFPAHAVRKAGITDVPLLCATEIDVAGALPRVVRLLAHIETPRVRSEIAHVYLRGAIALRRDLAQ